MPQERRLQENGKNASGLLPMSTVLVRTEAYPSQPGQETVGRKGQRTLAGGCTHGGG